MSEILHNHPQLQAMLDDPARLGEFRAFVASLSPEELAELEAFLGARLHELTQQIWQAQRNVRRLEREIAILGEDYHRITAASQALSGQLYGAFTRIYRDPKAALRACWELDKQHGPDAVTHTLKKSPATLGRLKGWALGPLMRLFGRHAAVTTAARLDYPALRRQLGQIRKLQSLLRTMLKEA